MKIVRMFLILLAVLFLLMGCTTEQDVVPTDALVTPEEESQEVEALPMSSFGETVVSDGQLTSLYPVLQLGFEQSLSGRISELLVKAGDEVNSGDLIARLDEIELLDAVDDAKHALARAIEDRDLAQQQWEWDLADAEAALASAERTLEINKLQASSTGVEEARTALEQAQRVEKDAKDEYDTPLFGEWTPDDERQRQYDAWQRAKRERELAEMRLADAYDSREISALETQAREDDVTQAMRKLEALQEGLAPSYERAIEDAQQALDEAEISLANARLTSPWTAIVLSVEVAPGTVINAGTPVVSLLSVEDGLRFVTQNLSEQHVAVIRPGQRAVVKLRTFPEVSMEGVVEAVIPQTTVQDANDSKFTVQVKLETSDRDLLPGLTGRVEIHTGD